MRILLDTNVLISAMIIKKGKPARLLEKLSKSHHTIIISKHILEEFSRISASDRIRKYVTAEETAKFLDRLVSSSTFVNVFSKFKILNSPDDLILATAYHGNAQFIVTGDEDLFNLGSFKGIRIIKVDRMLKLL